MASNNLKDWEEAYEIYSRLGEGLYRPSGSYYRMAEISIRLGKLKQAEENFRRANHYEEQMEDRKYVIDDGSKKSNLSNRPSLFDLLPHLKPDPL